MFIFHERFKHAVMVVIGLSIWYYSINRLPRIYRSLFVPVAYNQFFPQTNLNAFIDSKLLGTEAESYITIFKTVFFDIVVPNTVYNEALTQYDLNERLDRIALVRGRVEQWPLIISKGEVVQCDKLADFK